MEPKQNNVIVLKKLNLDYFNGQTLQNNLISNFGYEFHKKLYTFNYYDLLTFTKRIENKYQNIMLISHNPSIQNFCLEYVKNKKNNQDFEKLKQKFPTCAVAVLLSNAKKWSSIDEKGFEK